MKKRPRIEIDRDAIRFIDDEGQRNVFFLDIFRRSCNPQMDILGLIKKLYDKCVEQDIRAWSEQAAIDIHKTINKWNEVDRAKANHHGPISGD